MGAPNGRPSSLCSNHKFGSTSLLDLGGDWHVRELDEHHKVNLWLQFPHVTLIRGLTPLESWHS